MSIGHVTSNPFRLSNDGPIAQNPPNFFVNRKRRPTTTDWQNFDLGDLWMYAPPAPSNVQEIWVLVSLFNNIGKWVLLTNGSGPVLSLSGNTGSNPVFPIAGNIKVFGDGVTINISGDGVNTLTASTTGIIATEYVEDVGTAAPAAGILNVIGGQSAGGVAINMNTIGSGNTVKVCLNNSISQPKTNSSGTTGVYSLGSTGGVTDRFMHNYGTNNTFVGYQAGNLTLTVGSAVSNTCFGLMTGNALTTGSDNTLVGWGTGAVITTGQYNTAVGDGVLATTFTTGSYNVGVGHQVFSTPGLGLATGSYNIAVGADAGSDYTAAESHNILLNNLGTPGESNTLRVGQSTGTGIQQLNAAYVQGIYNIDVGATNLPVIIDNTGKLGTGTGGVPFYSTGTFTPTLTFGGTPITSYTDRAGKYTKIGNLVYVSVTITVNVLGAGVGTNLISGLPYVVTAATPPFSDGVMSIGAAITFSAGYTMSHALFAPGTSNIGLFQDGSGVSTTAFTNTNFANGSSFTVFGSYFIS